MCFDLKFKVGPEGVDLTHRVYRNNNCIINSLPTQQNFYFVAFALVSIISRLLTANLRSPPARPGLCVNKIMVLFRLRLCPPFCDIAIS